MKSFAIYHSGTQVFCSEIGVYVWNVQSGGVLAVTRDAERETSVAVRADGAGVPFTSSNIVNEEHVNRRRAMGTPLQGHAQIILGMALSGDGRQKVFGSCDRTTRVWMSSAEKQPRTLFFSRLQSVICGICRRRFAGYVLR